MDCEKTFSSTAILEKFKASMARTIVGQDVLIEGILMCFIAGGHVLIEGAPGLAKTLISKTFANLINASFKRIQFSPDLLPSDIVGNLVFLQDRARFAYRRGPIFANIILLDEINRAPAKVQSALLEAMQEGQVTIGRRCYPLPSPFFVLATENQIEEEGTYPLSEAQKDRFFMKLLATYPSKNEEITILEKIAPSFFSEPTDVLQTRMEKDDGLTFEEINFLKQSAKSVVVSREIDEYIVSIVEASRPNKNKAFPYLSYIEEGASPRASIALHASSQIYAMFHGRSYVIPEDIKYLSLPILRHRIKPSYDAIAENISADEIIEKILNSVAQP